MIWQSVSDEVHASNTCRPEVSIILPVYNRERYVAEAIKSVITQTEDNWELLCIDDGSTDASTDIIRSYATADARIRLIRTENRGVSAARNLGMEMAKGEWISFLDDDDWYEPQYLERMLAASDGAQLISAMMILEPSGEQRAHITEPVFCFDAAEGLAEQMGKPYSLQLPFNCYNKLYRRECLKVPFPEIFPECNIFNLENWKNFHGLSIVPDCLYHYRQHDGDRLTRKLNGKFNWQMYKGWIRILEGFDFVFQDCRKREQAMSYAVNEYRLRVCYCFLSICIRASGEDEKKTSYVKMILRLALQDDLFSIADRYPAVENRDPFPMLWETLHTRDVELILKVFSSREVLDHPDLFCGQ